MIDKARSSATSEEGSGKRRTESSGDAEARKQEGDISSSSLNSTDRLLIAPVRPR